MVVTRIIHRYCNRAKFVYNNQVPADDMDEPYDTLKAKYGIDSAIELSNYVNGKVHIIVEAGRELNMRRCPCCGGVKINIIPEVKHFSEEEIYLSNM
jgi:hypothetical protein